MTTSSRVKHLFNQIESIKSTMSIKNGSKPELWVQRQNLQDLYHQIILNDIDFTIDKKLEQDLWNLVFKSQINYFQQQIKENSLSSSSSSGASSSLTSSSYTSKTNKTISSQKKYEAQASLFFFLEAARGFYTKLLEDIVLTYDSKETLNGRNDTSFLLPFCQRFQSIFDKINDYSLYDSDETDQHRNIKTANEKQILYICQHILTHLGDIARYANLFQQAKNYYLHAIILVPYLGHPYNQLGILFETSRTNQLSTVFYYFRSIAVRYKFPLATTNLENFLFKLIDTPITRYNPASIDLNELNTKNTENYVIKLAHKDLITLFLQINAFIYFISNPTPKKSTTDLINKVGKYLDLFQYAFESFIRQPGQKDKLDSFQLCELISISIYLLDSSTNTSTSYAVKLFSNLVQNLLVLFNDSPLDDLSLPSLYLAFNYMCYCDETNLLLTNKLFKQNNKLEQTSKFIYLLVDVFNKLYEVNFDEIDLNKMCDYPLNEDRLLDSFVPLKQYHSSLNIAKYLRSSQRLSDSIESNLRKKRLIKSVELILERDLSKTCFVSFLKDKLILNYKSMPNDLIRKEYANGEIEKKETNVKPEVQKQQQQQQESEQVQPRRRRQNVAIHSITQMNLNQKNESNSKPLINQTQVETKMTTNSVLPNKANSLIPNQQQVQFNQHVNQYLPQQQPQQHIQANFFPSALNRKFGQQNGSVYVNEPNQLNNRPRQDGTNFFLSASQTQLTHNSNINNQLNQSYQSRAQNNNLNLNINNNSNNRSMNHQFESNLNQLSNMSGLNNQAGLMLQASSSSFFTDLNSSIDHMQHKDNNNLNTNISADTSSSNTISLSNIWPSTLPFSSNIDKNDSLFQNKPNWSHQFDSVSKSTDMDFNTQFLNMLNLQDQIQLKSTTNNSNSSNNSNNLNDSSNSELFSNLLFQLNSQANKINEQKSNQQQQNSIWSFNSSK